MPCPVYANYHANAYAYDCGIERPIGVWCAAGRHAGLSLIAGRSVIADCLHAARLTHARNQIQERGIAPNLQNTWGSQRHTRQATLFVVHLAVDDIHGELEAIEQRRDAHTLRRAQNQERVPILLYNELCHAPKSWFDDVADGEVVSFHWLM